MVIEMNVMAVSSDDLYDDNDESGGSDGLL